MDFTYDGMAWTVNQTSERIFAHGNEPSASIKKRGISWLSEELLASHLGPTLCGVSNTPTYCVRQEHLPMAETESRNRGFTAHTVVDTLTGVLPVRNVFSV